MDRGTTQGQTPRLLAATRPASQARAPPVRPPAPPQTHPSSSQPVLSLDPHHFNFLTAILFDPPLWVFLSPC